MADLFISDGIISKTRGRHPDSYQKFEASPDDFADGLPLIVLVDGSTASGAEILAVALQDSNRALVIGTGTHGLGTVQSQLVLPNQAHLVLTWASFFAPSGYAIHRRGVLPDICTADRLGNATELLAELRRGEGLIARKIRTRDINPDDEEELAKWQGLCPPSDADGETARVIALHLLAEPKLFADILGKKIDPQ